MNAKNNKKSRPGVALLVVLFIVMTITILSLGFVSRSDVELACGQNMVIRAQMDYLAESGLEHARGLILNPQDVGSGDWTGIHTELQLVDDSSNYYDVTVNRDANDFCNYIIDCDAYRLEGAEKIGLSRLHAELRLDPCIAYWVGSGTTITAQMKINGDVYCAGDLINNGEINGDVFATGTINDANITTGRKNGSVASAPVAWPNLTVTDFELMYYIDSTSTPYSAQQIDDPKVPTTPFEPSEANPAGILYCAAAVNMPGNVTINGTLVVNGDLTVSGPNNVIIAEPNFPALVVDGQVIMEDGGSLVINGLAQIGGLDPNTTNAEITVIGGLFIQSCVIISNPISVDVTAAPAIASIETWSETGVPTRWRHAAGAFFRSIERIK